MHRQCLEHHRSSCHVKEVNKSREGATRTDVTCWDRTWTSPSALSNLSSSQSSSTCHKVPLCILTQAATVRNTRAGEAGHNSGHYHIGPKHFCFLPQVLLQLTPPDLLHLSLQLGIIKEINYSITRKSSKAECRVRLFKAQSEYWQHQHLHSLVSFLALPLAARRHFVSSHSGGPVWSLCHLVRPWKLGSVHGGSAAWRLSSFSRMLISASRLSKSSSGVQDMSCWSL